MTVPHVTLIGERHRAPHACTDRHVPDVYVRRLDATVCQCQAVWWPGHVGTWHSRRLRVKVADTAGGGLWDDLGWDRYYLHNPDCAAWRDHHPPAEHLCGEGQQMTPAEAYGRTL